MRGLRHADPHCNTLLRTVSDFGFETVRPAPHSSRPESSDSKCEEHLEHRQAAGSGSARKSKVECCDFVAAEFERAGGCVVGGVLLT